MSYETLEFVADFVIIIIILDDLDLVDEEDCDVDDDVILQGGAPLTLLMW